MMKRKTLCAFSMVLWFLLFSTFFSLWVERQMIPWVTTALAGQSANSTQVFLPLDCLSEDEEGNAAVYQTVEGTGWEEGDRASLMDPEYYVVNSEEINLLYGGDMAIRYYSKPPQTGGPVNVVQNLPQEADTLLVLCQEGLPPLKEDIPKTYQVIRKTDTAMLIASEKTPSPFLPKKADSELFEADPFGGVKKEVYSLREIQAFTGGLRLLALVFGLVLLVLVLWLYSCFLTKNAKRHRSLLLVNGTIAVASLIALSLILRVLELPSSLLPRKNIVEFGHFTKEFSAVFNGLKAFAADGNAAAQAVLHNAKSALWVSLAILLAGAVSGLVIVLVERRYSRKSAYYPKHK